MANKTILVFFGPPGSGKGTQADMLGEKIKIPIISPGELLRAERDKKSILGIEVAARLSSGRLVTDKIVEKLLDNRLKKRDVKRGFILDGYPRRQSQLNFFKKRLTLIFKKEDKLMAIYIKVSDKNVEERISGRLVCDCGAEYHIKYNPPKKSGICDLCGAKLYRRLDDAPKIVRTRLHNFHHRIKPLLLHFKKIGGIIEINGEQDIKKVQAEIIKKLQDKKLIL